MKFELSVEEFTIIQNALHYYKKVEKRGNFKQYDVERINQLRDNLSDQMFTPNNKPMNKDRLKLIIKNLELLVEGLKAEVYSDTSSYNYEDIAPHIGTLNDYDEVFEDDDD
jgi:hypothetical protein